MYIPQQRYTPVADVTSSDSCMRVVCYISLNSRGIHTHMTECLCVLCVCVCVYCVLCVL